LASRGSAGGHNIKRTAVVENAWSLDVRQLQRNEFLEDGTWSNFRLARGDSRSVVIAFSFVDENLHLEFQSSDASGRSVDMRTSIEVTRVAKPYGGSQPYFLCPECTNRILILYFCTSGLICRRCANLAYTSTRESKTDAAFRRVRALRLTLGVHDLLSDVPQKPENMRWRAYMRLRLKLGAAEQILWSLLDPR